MNATEIGQVEQPGRITPLWWSVTLISGRATESKETNFLNWESEFEELLRHSAGSQFDTKAADD